MGSKADSSTALLITFTLLFSTVVYSSTYAPSLSSSPGVTSPAKSTSPAMPPIKRPSPAMSPTNEACPVDTLKLGMCVNLLNDLVQLIIGIKKNSPCCTLIGGLADLEAAVCLCSAIKTNNVLGINLNVPIFLNLLLNNCGKKAPSGFQCA